MITTPEEFVRLRNSPLQEEYSRAATEEASLAVWYEVIDLYPEMREWVAHNKTVPIEVLDLLSHDASESVRAAVADKRKLSNEIFDLLSLDPSEMVRLRLAYNKKAPASIVERLAIDSSPLVSSVASKRLLENQAGE